MEENKEMALFDKVVMATTDGVAMNDLCDHCCNCHWAEDCTLCSEAECEGCDGCAGEACSCFGNECDGCDGCLGVNKDKE